MPFKLSVGHVFTEIILASVPFSCWGKVSPWEEFPFDVIGENVILFANPIRSFEAQRRHLGMEEIELTLPFTSIGTYVEWESLKRFSTAST